MVNKQGDLGRNPPTCYSPGLCQQIAAFFPGGKASVLLRKLPVMGLHGAVSEWPLGLAASGYHGDSGQPHREPLLTFLPPRPPAPCTGTLRGSGSYRTERRGALRASEGHLLSIR